MLHIMLLTQTSHTHIEIKSSILSESADINIRIIDFPIFICNFSYLLVAIIHKIC